MELASQSEELFSSHAEEILRRAATLEAGARGNPAARFLALPIEDPLDASLWILASFQSPLAVAPFRGALPEEARDQLLRQLPAGSYLFPSELPPPLAGTSTDQKPLKSLWAVIFTSGSEGEPKGVALSGAALRASAEAHAANVGPLSWLLNLPLYHIGGFSVLTRAYFLGTRVAVLRGDSPLEDWLSRRTPQGISLVPTQLRRLLQVKAPLSHFQKILLGGAAASEDLLAEARSHQAPVHETYGMTEHASQIATERTPGGGLVPLSGVEVRIGEDHEIQLKSPCLAQGYYQRGELISLPSRAGFFPTGDLGELRDGILFVHGRKKELILSGGLNVYPREVERALASCAGLEDYAVVGLPDPEWGEVVCAAVTGSVSPEEIRRHLAARLDGRKVPKRLFYLDKLPRTPLGKIDRNALIGEIQKKFLASR